MAVAFRSASALAAANNASFTVTKPAGVLVGDLMLLTLYAKGTALLSPDVSWTGMGMDSVIVANGRLRHFYRVVDGSEPASWVVTAGGGSSNQTMLGGIVAYSGVDPASCDSGTRVSTTTVLAADTNFGPMNGLTTTAANSLVVAMGGRQDDWGAFTAQFAWTDRLSGGSALGSDAGLTFAERAFPTAGTATGTVVHILSSSTAALGHGTVMELRPVTVTATYTDMDASVLGAATISLVGLDPLMDMSVPIIGSGALAADLTGYSDASAAIAGTSSLAAALGMVMDATAAIAGTSLITSSLTLYNPVDMSAAIASSGLVAADLTGYSDATASIVSTAALAASLGLLSDVSAAITGSAALAASMDFVQDLTASLASQATLTGDLTPITFVDLTTGITASGVMTADLGMLRDLTASMSASGAVTGTLGIVTDMSAGIASGAVIQGDLGSLMDLAAALSASALMTGDLTFLLAAGTTPDLRGPLVALVTSGGGHATMIDLTANASSPDHDGRASSDSYSGRASQPSNEVRS